MRALTKFDVLLYIQQAKNWEELVTIIRKNALFSSISERTIRARVNELRKDGFVEGLNINNRNKKTWDCLAFLHWARMRGFDYNKLMEKNVARVFTAIFENYKMFLREVIEKTALSKPTVIDIIKLLEKNNFLEIKKRKPLFLTANLNDMTFFYANFIDASFDSFQKQFQKVHEIKTKITSEMRSLVGSQSKILTEQLIRLHVYSTTVTEGNTATEDDVKNIFDNTPVKLTPREITEILNAREAVNHVYDICDEEIGLFEIKKTHKILMNNLSETSGDFFYGAKRNRVTGSETKFPNSKEEIDSGIAALLNFYKKQENVLNPLILAAITHFIFVTIHPFADGNGRISRLIHSWILLKSKMPLFVFHVNKKNTYFDLLEEGRKSNIEEFIKFCSEEYYGCIIDVGMAEFLDKEFVNELKKT